MSHHGRTAASVIAAPSRTFDPVAIHYGAPRRFRRHGVPIALKPTDLVIYLTTRNVPHVRTSPRRGKKVRRHRKVEQ